MLPKRIVKHSAETFEINISDDEEGTIEINTFENKDKGIGVARHRKGATREEIKKQWMDLSLKTKKRKDRRERRL